MSRRIFEGQPAGPPTETTEGRGESANAKARRQIIELLRTDPETQERFQKSGKTEEVFINDHVKYFGENAVANLTQLGYDTIVGDGKWITDRKKRSDK